MSKLISTTLGLAFVCSNLASADLVAHWPLDTDAMDASGNDHHGTLVNSPTFGEPGANAATGMSTAFPGTAHIDVPYDAALNPESFTVTLWALPNTVTGAHQSPITSRDDSPGPLTHGYILYRNPAGNWDFWTGDGNVNWPGLSGGAAAQGAWTHVAITYLSPADGGGAAGTKRIYVNGTLAATRDTPDNNTTLYVPNGTAQSENLHIGSGGDAGTSFYWDGNIDDIGLWDEVLSELEIQSVMNNGVASLNADPLLQTTNPLVLDFDGVDGAFDIEITNGGTNEDLNIIGTPAIGGPDAASFSVTNTPTDPISPGGMADIECLFDPLGGNGLFEGTFDITSDDSEMPNQTITVQMRVHDPKIITDTSVDFGSFPAGSPAQPASLPVQNDGFSRTLTLSATIVSAPDAGHFMVTSTPIPIAAGGGSGNIELSFDSLGEEGMFDARIEITSDDPFASPLIVPLAAFVEYSSNLVAWWPLDTDASDASGNGYDGTVLGDTVTFAQSGANPATGNSASFTGNGHIDVPFDNELNPASFSVTLWANASIAGGGAYGSPITSRDDVGGGVSTWGYVLYNDNNGNWSFWSGDGAPGWDANTGPAVTLSTWTHIALTYDADTGTKTLWVNGVAEASDVLINQYQPNGSVQFEDLHIGSGSDNGLNHYWEGQLDDVGLFRTALSAEEISDIMTGGVGSLVDTRPFVITKVRRLPGNKVELTWNSRLNKMYTVFWSTDGTDFGADAGDGFASGGETTTVIINDGDAPIAASPTLLFKVGENAPPPP